MKRWNSSNEARRYWRRESVSAAIAGVCPLDAGEYQHPEASDYLDKISKAGDKTTDFWLLRTVVQHQNKQTQEAIQSILKAEKMNPATPRFSLEHATIFANTGKSWKPSKSRKTCAISIRKT